MQVYVVGGAVRDALLNLPAGDKDWVVVGTTPEAMQARGFIPVGGDFPVFLHPRSKEEYALARTERKSGRGYQGFTFYTGTEVTLEDDLRRRDLTINAMALGATGSIIDPLNGLQDLQAKLLRHVGDAFVEDPVRLLRLARFAARFSSFSIAAETEQLAQQLVADGEVDALVPERIWQELRKALNTQAPWRFIQVLESVHATQRVLPGLRYDTRVEQALHQAIEHDLDSVQRYAVLCGASDNALALATSIRASAECRDLSQLVSVSLSHAALDAGASAETQLQWLEQLDALRRPERFKQLVGALRCYRPVDESLWLLRLEAVLQVDAASIARQYAGQGAQIRATVQAARVVVLSSLMAN
ncbi:CCA tRNA nucleotidyltransferase [Paenalcaligenes suwonensis]|nr:CCA tRNA nucleotidyltransferase [Paenalcaligenes suwonensis]